MMVALAIFIKKCIIIISHHASLPLRFPSQVPDIIKGKGDRHPLPPSLPSQSPLRCYTFSSLHSLESSPIAVLLLTNKATYTNKQSDRQMNTTSRTLCFYLSIKQYNPNIDHGSARWRTTTNIDSTPRAKITNVVNRQQSINKQAFCSFRGEHAFRADYSILSSSDAMIPDSIKNTNKSQRIAGIYRKTSQLLSLHLLPRQRFPPSTLLHP